MSCEYCGGGLTFLGRLGAAEYARCEGCGMDYMLHSRELEALDNAEERAMLAEESGYRAREAR